LITSGATESAQGTFFGRGLLMEGDYTTKKWRISAHVPHHWAIRTRSSSGQGSFQDNNLRVGQWVSMF